MVSSAEGPHGSACEVIEKRSSFETADIGEVLNELTAMTAAERRQLAWSRFDRVP